MSQRHFILIDATVESQAPFFAQNPLFKTWLHSFNNIPEALQYISEISLPYSIEVYMASDHILDDGLPDTSGQKRTLIQTFCDLQTIRHVSIFVLAINVDLDHQILTLIPQSRSLKNVVSVANLQHYMCTEGIYYFTEEIHYRIGTNNVHLIPNLQRHRNELMKYSEHIINGQNKVIEALTNASSNRLNEFSEQSSSNTKWKQEGITVAGGNDRGNQLNQLDRPHGIFINDNQTIYIADVYNHRIVEWKPNATNGQIVAGGNQMNQLNYPRYVLIDKENNLIIADCQNRRVIRWSLENNTTNEEIIIDNIDCSRLTMDKDGSLYVSDSNKNEVKRWKRGDTEGTIVAGGNGKGNNLNQFSCPTYIFVDEDYSLYVSDRDNHRVMKWLKDAKEGIFVAGGNDQGNRSTQLSFPYGVIVDQLGQIYVADKDNHRVMCWYKGAKEGITVVGGNGRGQQSNQMNGPEALSFDRQGNLYVVDCSNHRVQKFEIN